MRQLEDSYWFLLSVSFTHNSYFNLLESNNHKDKTTIFNNFGLISFQLSQDCEY